MEFPNLSFSPWVIPAAALGYGLIHSVMASTRFKHLVYSLLGNGAKKYYRLLFSIFATIALLPVLALIFLIPDIQLYTIPAPYRYLTVLIQAASIGLLAYSILQTGAMQFVGVPQALGMQYEDRLNTGGLYRYMRHPLYAFSLLVIWLTPVMTRNLLLLFAALTVYILIGALFEERKLQQAFGPDYAAYKAKTPFLFPCIFR